ncbi:MAG: ethanolamine ammonia-lyase reactivating factor EutA [Propionibacteriaceae bacterium]|nr:ethanolamine ammonia-lyase reactivating factor EutA [Propionibacteriaceae bacterium]
MSEVILSVGIDVGTSTTSVVFSRLTLDNLAGAFSVPRIEITDKDIVYRSQVYETPLLSPDMIDAAALRALVLDEYRQAGYAPSDVKTGAAIITGETARAENASQVLAALSELAGEFVVATAGPHLESVLAARGAGADTFSKNTSKIVANLDIGGGTTNIAVFRFGKLLGTSCLDIGGRLVRIKGGQITYVSEQAQRLAQSAGLTVAVGQGADVDKLTTLTRLMARQLAMALGLATRDAIHPRLYTNDGAPLSPELSPGVISFSGGVADLIGASRSADPFRYNDIGPMLGSAIAEDSAFSLVERHQALETIAATVVGAGIHTTEVSGSTIEFAGALLPLQNIPIVRIPEAREHPDQLAAEIDQRLRLLHPEKLDDAVAIAFTGQHVSSFDDVQQTALAIIDGASHVLKGPNPLIVVLERDRAKVLGQSMATLRGRRDDVICIDGVQTTSGDYIDIGNPVGAGRAVPVVVKTLVFND